MSTKITLTHPGIILRDEFLTPYGLNASTVAKATGIPNSRLSEIFAGRRGISADTAVRIGKFLGLDPQSFINLQAHYDRVMAEDALERQRPRVHIEHFSKFVAHA